MFLILTAGSISIYSCENSDNKYYCFRIIGITCCVFNLQVIFDIQFLLQQNWSSVCVEFLPQSSIVANGLSDEISDCVSILICNINLSFALLYPPQTAAVIFPGLTLISSLYWPLFMVNETWKSALLFCVRWVNQSSNNRSHLVATTVLANDRISHVVASIDR